MSNMLPIEQIKSRVMQALQTRNVVVQSPTGSGKSTALPLWCMTLGRVLIIEPRRLACRSLAHYVAHLHGSSLGTQIGYAVRFDSQFSADSQAVFVTPGIALRWFAETNLADFDVVILDEFHERRWDTDLLAALLLHQQNSDSIQRIVITSATVDGQRLANYVQGEFLQASGRQFPVQVRFTEQHDLPSLNSLDKRVTDAVDQTINSSVPGDILVFLPGRAEIGACLDTLRGRHDAELIPLHASVDKGTQDRALNPGARRRILLSTNVAETSLTIPGVTVVIDSGLERRTHHRNGRTVLGLHAVSQAAADQRSGRAGRTAPGQCIRLWGQNAALERFTPPEVEREELTELLMAAGAAGVTVEQLDFCNPLPEHAVSKAHELLTSMHAINAQGALTEHGRHLFPLPIDPLFAHLITAMPDTETKMAMADISSALTVGRPLIGQFDNVQQAQAFKDWNPLSCDIVGLIQLIRGVIPDQLPLIHPACKEARQIARQIRQALGLPALPGTIAFPREQLLTAAIAAYPRLAYVRREKRPQALGNGFDEVEIGRESQFPDSAEAAVVFDVYHSPGKGLSKTSSKATCMAPISLTQLSKAGLGTRVFVAPRWETNQVLVESQTLYAGRVIQREEQAPVGAALHAALAELIVNNRVLRPVGRQLQSDIAAWNLYLQLGLGEGAPAEADQWLEQRLAALGVITSEDFQLISAEDLSFEGIPAWERDDFEQRYPRQLTLSNLTMSADYDPKRRRVELIYQNGHRKEGPTRLELPAWQGWRVDYRRGSKRVQLK